MKRYQMLGRPNVPFPEIQDHQIGDVFEADIDSDVETLLVGAGALRLLGSVKPKAEKKATSEKATEEPASETTPAAEKPAAKAEKQS